MIDLVARGDRRRGAPVAAGRATCASSPTEHGVSCAPRWGTRQDHRGAVRGHGRAHADRARRSSPAIPVEISPLARVDRNDPFLTERFELFVGGRELANGYSELNDPVEQRAAVRGRAGAPRTPATTRPAPIDEDYLRALEYGMPPTGGLGIGMDRVVMLLAGVTSIKEVILFPTLRPEVF